MEVLLSEFSLSNRIRGFAAVESVAISADGYSGGSDEFARIDCCVFLASSVTVVRSAMNKHLHTEENINSVHKEDFNEA